MHAKPGICRRWSDPVEIVYVADLKSMPSLTCFLAVLYPRAHTITKFVHGLLLLCGYIRYDIRVWVVAQCHPRRVPSANHELFYRTSIWPPSHGWQLLRDFLFLFRVPWLWIAAMCGWSIYTWWLIGGAKLLMIGDWESITWIIMIIHSFQVLEVRTVVIIITIIIRGRIERSGDALLTEFCFLLGHQDKIIAIFNKSSWYPILIPWTF